MTAVIRVERGWELGQGCVRRLRLFVSCRLVTTVLFRERRADPRRDQLGLERGGGSRAESDSKRTVRRDPAVKGQNSQPPRRGVRRRKDKDGKADDDGLEFMQAMANGLGTRLAIFLLARLMLSFSGQLMEM